MGLNHIDAIIQEKDGRTRIRLRKNLDIPSSEMAALGVEMFLRVRVEVEQRTGDLLVGYPGTKLELELTPETVIKGMQGVVEKWEHSNPQLDPVMVALVLTAGELPSDTFARFRNHLAKWIPEARCIHPMGVLIYFELPVGEMSVDTAKRLQWILSFGF